MRDRVSISVVIPTCNRPESLLLTLRSIGRSQQTIDEIIIVDSGDNEDAKKALAGLTSKTIYIRSQKSVCIQRNMGIHAASAEWIFLCDDDIEVPVEYLPLLVNHAINHPHAGAISGLVLQNENGQWKDQYPIMSGHALWWNSIFNLGIWGNVPVTGKISRRYRKRGNHISKAGWPVVIDFSGNYFKTPVYGLGASLVKKDWLLQSPYDEILDRSGIGDNYGVAMGFPTDGIHVLTQAHVFHHRVKEQRIHENLSFYRRLLALDYFITIKKCQKHVTRMAYQWSLVGIFFSVMKSGELKKAFATMKVLLQVTFRRNPYVVGKRKSKKVIQPAL